MIISLHEGDFNTSDEDDFDLLLFWIDIFREYSEDEELDAILAAIENAPILTRTELRLYEAMIGEPEIVPLQTHKYFRLPLYDANGCFTFLDYEDDDGKFIALPGGANRQEVVYKLITKLVYESYRHSWDGEPCVTLRRVICKLDEHYNLKMSREWFQNALESIERETKNYYGEYSSDDSDSEEEQNYDSDAASAGQQLLERINKETGRYTRQLDKLLNSGSGTYEATVYSDRPKKFPTAKADRALVCFYCRGNADTKNWYYVVGLPGERPQGRGKKVRKNLNSWMIEKKIHEDTRNITSSWTEFFSFLQQDKALQDKITGQESIQPDVSLLAKIHHPELNETIRADLERLNRGESTVNTKFVVAQYRGIHYEKRQWNIFSRRRHRELDEVRSPLYSRSVVARSGFQDFCSLLLALEQDEQNTKNFLQRNAQELERQMRELRASGPIVYEGSSYLNVLDLLQELYTANYKKFHALLESIVAGENGQIKFLEVSVFNSYNPFLSTGDTAQHALKYAYGLKPYSGSEAEKRENERVLQNLCWCSSGKRERDLFFGLLTSRTSGYSA